MGDDDTGRAWWVWLLGALSVIALVACAAGGYLVYQMASYNPTNQYQSGEGPPPCLPGSYHEARAACRTCPSDDGAQSVACLYKEYCIDGECLRPGRCTEFAPQRIDYCTE